MKNLFVLFVLFPSFCFSQKRITFEEADSLSKAGVYVMVDWDTARHEVYYRIANLEEINSIKIDTVFSFLLMSDISDSSGTTLNGNGIAFWQMGWEILENEVSIGYLDFDKVPFAENIIIWQSKQY